MRRVIPDHLDMPFEALYAGLVLGDQAPEDRRWLALGMVSTVDGAASLDGRTASLGGKADKLAFRQLRTACDAIIVGAGTVRDERYGPPTASAGRRTDRRQRGLAEVPRLVIVSGNLSLDPHHRVFGDPAHRPIIVTTVDAARESPHRLAAVADLLPIGHGQVDLTGTLDRLAELGLRRVLSEGGPTLNAALTAEDLVDELFVTLAPVVVGGDAPRIAYGTGMGAARTLQLTSVYEHAGELLLRYGRSAA